METLSVVPSGINASNLTVCSGDPVTLTIQGGFLGTNSNWLWYEGGCGAGTTISSGTQIIVTPTNQTTYFARAEGTCNTTNCISVTINTLNLSTAPTAIVPSAN